MRYFTPVVPGQTEVGPAATSASGNGLTVMVRVVVTEQLEALVSVMAMVLLPTTKLDKLTVPPGIAVAPLMEYVIPVPVGNVIVPALWQYALFRNAKLGAGIAFTTTVLVAVTEQLSGLEVVVTKTVWLPTPKVAGLKEAAAVPLIVKVLPVTVLSGTAGAFKQ